MEPADNIMKNPELHDISLCRTILSRGRYTTLALSDGNDPYALSLHYAQDPNLDILYFLTDKGGTKLDFFRSDPYICGTVVNEDQDGISSVVYRGLVEVVHREAEQEKILDLLRSRDLPFLRINGDEGENSMYLRLLIEEITLRRFL
jgi:nitroimidazol reductase NimA-like FMN-containing flavoprotein (pyridoxamine 5'-phosphate oxidase superfamily)